MPSPVDPTAEPPQPPRSESQVPQPPRARRRLHLTALGLVAALGSGLALLLLPDARFSLTPGPSHSLGAFETAHLDELAKSSVGSWVSGSGVLSPQALSFARQGENQRLMLAPLLQRPDFWVLLPVFAGAGPYVPPRNFSGRLLRVGELGLAQAPVAQLLSGQHLSSPDSALDSPQGSSLSPSRQLPSPEFLLIEQATPQSYRVELYAGLLSALVGALALFRLLRLLWPVSVEMSGGSLAPPRSEQS